MDERLQPVSGCFFDDIIDGYFPLRTSLAQMMQRNGFEMTLLSLSHAPIIQVPGLPHDAPVPLNVRDGRAGMIDHISLWVWWSGDDLQVAGEAEWRFWTGQKCSPRFDPMTRLAEPAVVGGLGVFRTGEKRGHFRKTSMAVRQTRMAILNVTDSMLGLKQSNALLWGPRPNKAEIRRRERDASPVYRRLDDMLESLETNAGVYVLTDPKEASALQQ